MKKNIIILSFILIAILLVINYRTPFLTKEKSSWSVGFGHFDNLEDSKNIEDKYIFSKEKLKLIDTTTIFLADPFFIYEKDKYYLFFEHQKNKPGADISLMVSDDGLHYKFKGSVLDETFHLSYPQVFKHEDDFYMIPESQGAQNVLLYKSYNFPYDWRVKDTLLKNIKLKDPTIYLSDDYNILLGSDDEMNLHLYHADSLLGKWSAHENKTVMMGTEARPGGRFIEMEDNIYIPIQNSTKGYGYGLSLYKFEYNDGDYKINRTFPLHLKANPAIQAFNAGMHHLDFQKVKDKYYAVYDGNTFENNPKTKLNIRGPLKWNYKDFMNWVLK